METEKTTELVSSGNDTLAAELGKERRQNENAIEEKFDRLKRDRTRLQIFLCDLADEVLRAERGRRNMPTLPHVAAVARACARGVVHSNELGIVEMEARHRFLQTSATARTVEKSAFAVECLSGEPYPASHAGETREQAGIKAAREALSAAEEALARATTGGRAQRRVMQMLDEAIGTLPRLLPSSFPG